MMTYLALATTYLMTSLAHADRVATSNSSDAPATRMAMRSGLRDLKRCAEGTASGYFGADGQTLVKWQASAMSGGAVVEYPSVAVSSYVPRGLDAKGPPGFLTVTDNQLLFTPANKKPHPYDWVESSTNLTLNLMGAIKPENNLPVVDTRDSIDEAWAEELFWRKGGGDAHGASFRKFGRSDFHDNETAIKSGDALSGEAGQRAMTQLTEFFRQRIQESPGRIEYIYQQRQRVKPSFDRRAGPSPLSERFLTNGDLKEIKDGLCSCEGLFEEVETTRQQILKSPVRFWDNGSARELRPEDLSCGMV